VEELGILPFFRCGIDGFSVEEMTPPEFWFVRGVDGPWEWRQQTIDRYAYGKFLCRKAGFISFSWFPALCNYRRDGLDFIARYEDGRVPQAAKQLYGLIRRQSRSTVELKGLAPGADSAFDRAITSLMMSTDAVITGFDLKIDSRGRPYGWGISRYAAADLAFGEEACAVSGEAPEESLERMRAHVLSLCPGAPGKAVEKLLRA
jgi:hypothetical protein